MRRCRDEVGVRTLAETDAAYRPDPKCPGAALTAPGGTAPPAASQGGAAAAAAGGSPPLRCTILERCRKLLLVWVSFIRLCAKTSPSSARPSCVA